MSTDENVNTPVNTPTHDTEIPTVETTTVDPPTVETSTVEPQLVENVEEPDPETETESDDETDDESDIDSDVTETDEEDLDDEYFETELETNVYGETLFKSDDYVYVVMYNNQPVSFNYSYASARKTMKRIMNYIVSKQCSQFSVLVDSSVVDRDYRYEVTYLPRNIFSFGKSVDNLRITKIYRN